MSQPATKSYPVEFKERAVKLAVETDQPIDSQFLRQDFATSRLVGEVSTAFFYSRFSVDQYEPYREDTVLWLGHQRQALCIEVDGHDLQNIR